MLLNLIQKALSSILGQVEVIAEFLNYLIRIIIFKNFDFLDMLSIKFDF